MEGTRGGGPKEGSLHEQGPGANLCTDLPASLRPGPAYQEDQTCPAQTQLPPSLEILHGPFPTPLIGPHLVIAGCLCSHLPLEPTPRPSGAPANTLSLSLTMRCAHQMRLARPGSCPSVAQPAEFTQKPHPPVCADTGHAPHLLRTDSRIPLGLGELVPVHTSNTTQALSVDPASMLPRV